MGFCYPGKGKSGDLPPLPICARTWRQRMLDEMPCIKLALVIGQYAQAWHLPTRRETITEAVRHWKGYGKQIMPLPHPGPHNNIWLSKNPWFEAQLILGLRKRVKTALRQCGLRVLQIAMTLF